MKPYSNIRNFFAFMFLVMFASLLFSDGAFSKGMASTNSQVDAGAGKVIEAKIHSLYGKLPLCFIPNKGQLNQEVKFYEKSKGKTFFFLPDAVLITFMADKKKKERVPENRPADFDFPPGDSFRQYVKLSFLGANKNMKVVKM